MIWALMIISACGVVEEPAESVSPVEAAATADTLRNCLTIAGGLRAQERNDAAVEQVYTCYDRHFAPMEPMLREKNRRATMSLEYGFGVLAVNMGKRRGDPIAEAVQLADRVEAVIDSVQSNAAPAAPAKADAASSAGQEQAR